MENQTNPQNLEAGPAAGSLYDNWIQPINDKLSQLRLENIGFTDNIRELYSIITDQEKEVKTFARALPDIRTRIDRINSKLDSSDCERCQQIGLLNSKVLELDHKYIDTLNVLTELRASMEDSAPEQYTMAVNCFSLIELRIAHNYNLQMLNIIKSWGFWRRLGFLFCPAINYISAESFDLEPSDDN